MKQKTWHDVLDEIQSEYMSNITPAKMQAARNRMHELREQFKYVHINLPALVPKLKSNEEDPVNDYELQKIRVCRLTNRYMYS